MREPNREDDVLRQLHEMVRHVQKRLMSDKDREDFARRLRDGGDPTEVLDGVWDSVEHEVATQQALAAYRQGLSDTWYARPLWRRVWDVLRGKPSPPRYWRVAPAPPRATWPDEERF